MQLSNSKPLDLADVSSGHCIIFRCTRRESRARSFDLRDRPSIFSSFAIAAMMFTTLFLIFHARCACYGLTPSETWAETGQKLIFTRARLCYLWLWIIYLFIFFVINFAESFQFSRRLRVNYVAIDIITYNFHYITFIYLRIMGSRRVKFEWK